MLHFKTITFSKFLQNTGVEFAINDKSVKKNFLNKIYFVTLLDSNV